MTLSKKKKPAAASSVVSGEALGMDANIAMLEKSGTRTMPGIN